MQPTMPGNRQSARQRYLELCASESTVPIFSQPWWLDITAGPSGWDVALVEKGGRVVGSMPFATRKRFGFCVSTQPQLTQCLGPWLRGSDAKMAKRLAAEKDVMYALIDQLPSFAYFSQNWHRSLTNWLPFYWRGFRQTTKYTYVLPDLRDEETLWAGLDQSIRTDIRKATGRFGLRVRDDLDIDDFLPLNNMVFSRQGKQAPYSDDLLRRLDAACKARDRRMILIAEDDQGRRHAGVYVVWDSTSAYYLMGGGDPALRGSGATSLCLWNAITRASGLTNTFDFEGSMMEPIERFVRSFGAEQVPYINVRRTGSRMWQTIEFLHTLRSGPRPAH